MGSSAETPKSKIFMYMPPLVAGAVAGISVDVILYPLDTLKTRLQSEKGFQKAGGFKGVYRDKCQANASHILDHYAIPQMEDESKEWNNIGHIISDSCVHILGLLTVATSSMPTTALFFMSYETTKKLVQPHVAMQYAPLVHMLAASAGEVLACVIRVPTEIAKQRKQTYVGGNARSSIAILAQAYKTEGFRRGLYRGFLSTVARDLPFSFIELPLWELMKTTVRDHNDGRITSFQSAICGSLAGGMAAAATTPLDLAKTRIMLAEDYTTTRKLKIRPVLEAIYFESGIKGLFAGVTPRMSAFMLGGFVFFGVYDDTKRILEQYLENR